MSRLYQCVTFCCFAIASITVMPQQPTETQEDDRIILPAQDPDSVSRHDFMRTKLLFSQNVLEGLTTGDFELIDEAIKEIEQVTKASQWVAIDDEKYRKLTEDFKTATNQLKAAAATKNVDATALRFYNMSTSCIDCHKHIRKAGYEF